MSKNNIKRGQSGKVVKPVWTEEDTLRMQNSQLKKHVEKLEDILAQVAGENDKLRKKDGLNCIAMVNMLYQLGGTCEISDTDVEEISGDISVVYDEDGKKSVFTLVSVEEDTDETKVYMEKDVAQTEAVAANL